MSAAVDSSCSSSSAAVAATAAGMHRIMQVILVCTAVFVVCQLSWSSTGNPHIGTTQTLERHSFWQKAISGSAEALAVHSPRTRMVATRDQRVNLSTQTREWFLTHPSTHCARHQLHTQKRVSQSPFVSGDTFRSMADHTMDDTRYGKRHSVSVC
jgi:hypothetical protein